MKREVFGVFGERETFESLRQVSDFDTIVDGPLLTVGLRDPVLGRPGRSDTFEGTDGFVAIWGEAYAPDGVDATPAEWLYSVVRDRGFAAFERLNGSYVAAVDVGDLALVATDAIRSWETFYTDAPGRRVFGTDASAVARTIPRSSVDPGPLYEFLILGGALNHGTPIVELDRLPLDHGLTPGGTVDLGRYRHDPREFDYAGELAERLERAIARRRDLPGRKGLLLSAGFDSRVLLDQVDDIDATYTLGRAGSSESRVAEDLAATHGTDHTRLDPDRRYLSRDDGRFEYTNGVKESLHIHHGGYESAIDAETMYHGLLWDTILRGYFLPRRHIQVFDLTIPRQGMDPDPDPVSHLADILGYLPGGDPLIEASDLEADTGPEFFEESIAPAYEACTAVEPSPYAALERFGVQNVLSSPFRTHLADRYVEGLVPADLELIDWHLHTPPTARTEQTFQDALEYLDPGLLDPRPPDRPHTSFLGNQIEKRLRQSLPGVDSFDAPWPDRRALYREHDMDAVLLPDRPDLHQLPPRVKLRIDDLRRWIDLATDGQRSIEPFLPELAQTTVEP